jgi:hypothetical protein
VGSDYILPCSARILLDPLGGVSKPGSVKAVGSSPAARILTEVG